MNQIEQAIINYLNEGCATCTELMRDEDLLGFSHAVDISFAVGQLESQDAVRWISANGQKVYFLPGAEILFHHTMEEASK